MLSPAKHDGIGGFMKIGYTPSTRLVSYTITLEGVRGLCKFVMSYIAVCYYHTLIYLNKGARIISILDLQLNKYCVTSLSHGDFCSEYSAVRFTLLFRC